MKQQHKTSGVPRVEGARVAILQAKWHRELSDVMVRRCTEVLRAAGALDPEIHLIPGSLELPIAAQHLMKREPRFDAIIAFGIILKGETDHYDVVRDCCFQGLSRVSLDSDVPIISEVLPVATLDLAKARCSDDEFNKGIEAGIAAAEIISWRRKTATTAV